MRRPDPVPAEYGGKWVAWTLDGMHVLGSGETPAMARHDAEAKGPQTAFDWQPSDGVCLGYVPRSDAGSLGWPAVRMQHMPRRYSKYDTTSPCPLLP